MKDLDRLEHKVDRLTWLMTGLIALSIAQFLPSLLSAVSGVVSMLGLVVIAVVIAMAFSPKARELVPRFLKAAISFFRGWFDGDGDNTSHVVQAGSDVRPGNGHAA